MLEKHDLKRLLHKGYQSPSPRPDGLEKWVLAELDEADLEIVHKSLNFVLLNNYFDKLRNHYILRMYKNRGLYTELTNYRAVCFGPLLAVPATSWLTTLAQEYAMRRRLIPETQTAVQSGTQQRDLTSYLSQVQAWAYCHNQTLYALVRDQKKGFDLLRAEAGHDAYKFFGLPESVEAFD
ncbi:BQ2448_3536 [Microbotryum intermedium]|uniref:BQ2448_3536 protein n=1 Tax=Microbotryum intermedium TaxID=269621 RepID=A0A238FFW8_9BASI|nr:BQ2448_3536 [Microbotryum intermedium]